MVDQWIYETLFLFFIYAFLGWCAEVSYHAVVTGKFINRGFLNGPVCPVYGIGALSVLFLLKPFQENLFLLFLFSVILTSVLEFLVGFLLEKIFHARWWDYSEEPFHLGPYLCLKFSLMWGFACVFVIKFLQPLALHGISFLPQPVGISLLALFSTVLLVDLFLTVITVSKFFRQLKHLDGLAAEIHNLSDWLGIRISDSALDLLKKQQTGKAKLLEYKEQLDQKVEDQVEQMSNKLEGYKEEFQKKLSSNFPIHRRILKAYPRLSSKKHQRVLDIVRETINRRKK